jgi:hypothetical protein
MPQPTSSLLWSSFHPYVILSFIWHEILSSQYVGNYLAGHAKKTLRVPKTAVKPDLYQVFIKLPIELQLVVRQLLVTSSYSLPTLVLLRFSNIVTQ